MRFMISVAVASLSIVSLCTADPAHAAVKKFTDISAQPLGAALQALAKQRDFQIICRADLVADLRTQRLSGEFTEGEALGQLLNGTNLTYQYLDDRTVTIVPIAASAPRAQSSASSPGVGTAGASRKSFWERFRVAQADQRGAPEEEAGQRPGSAADTVRLEEVVITGEKSDRSLKETATSVSVLSEETLRRQGLQSLEEVLSQLTNVTNIGSGLVPTVRGVDGTGPASGGTAFLAGTRTRLNIQVDGRPLSFNEAAYGDATMYDVQQVEMLRGPQSTLQGRNSIAGTLAIRTKDPTFDFHAGMQLSGGSNDYRQAAGYVSMPLVEDQLAVRLVADFQERESFVKMQPWSAEPNPGRFETRTLRGKLLYRPRNAEDFEASLTINHSESQAPQVEYVTYPYGDHLSASVPTLGSSEPVFRPKATAAILGTHWGIAPNVELESMVSLTGYGVTRSVLPGTGDAEIDGTELIVEPRLRLKLMSDRLRWLSGVFYYKARQTEMIDIIAPNNYKDRTETYAAFTEGVYAATDRLSFTLGGRYERESRVRYSTQALFGIDLDETVDAFMPKAGMSYALNDAVTVGVLATRGFNGGGAGLVLRIPVIQYVYSPEHVWNYEAYLRALVNDRMSVSANVFYSDYKDMQVNFDTDPSGGYAYYVVNLEDVKTRGADIGVNYATDVGVSLSADIGVLHSKIKTDTLLNGMELNGAPDLTASFGVSYRAPWGLELSVNARYSAAYYSSSINLETEKVDPFWVANAKAAYSLNDRIQLFVSSTNLFDTGASTFLSSLTSPPYANIVRPRAFNAGVTVNF